MSFGLGPASASKDTVMNLLLEQAKRVGATLITVTHDHALLERFDRVIDFADLAEPVQDE